MSLLALELSDAGIMAAGGKPSKLLELDGQDIESPGFALPEKNRLLVGRAAEKMAHLFPRQILNQFWDELNTEPLEHPGSFAPQHQAEIVYSHLARIWEQLQKHGNKIVMAVPSFFDCQQLGLILGISRELSMPVKGFIPLALAASSNAYPGKMLLHLDIHLHRVEVDYLKQDDHLTLEDSETSTDKGLICLYKEWVDTIAREFVRTTRFDPYHQAASEQELYDRLPGVLLSLQHNPSIAFEMSGGSRTYSVMLTRELIAGKAETVYEEFRRIIEQMRAKHGKDEPPVVLQLTHRLARLPGYKKMLTEIKNAEIVALDPGAGAYGVLGIWNQLSSQPDSAGISFFTSRPWHQTRRIRDLDQPAEKSINRRPTHLLYRSMAYPISARPLYIGRKLESGETGVRIQGRVAGVSRRHFSIQLRGRDVVLNDLSTYGTFVDETRISGSAVLRLGQIIRIGTPGEELQLIACLDNDET